MGCDYQYESGNQWFKNLDKLLRYVNADGRVHAVFVALSLSLALSLFLSFSLSLSFALALSYYFL